MDYEKINWENQPSKKTPINATNLNHMDDGIYEAHERINANSIISTAQGETILVTDSAKVPPENIKLFGKTTQVTTEGNQLLSIPDKTETRNGLTFTIVDGTCTIKGTPTNDTLCWFLGGYDNTEIIFTLPPGNYYIKDCRIWSYDGTTRVNKTGALALTENFNVTGVYTETYTSGTAVNATIYPMINKGLTALPFEPYTGGQPSPSINYPQPLNNVGAKGNIIGNILTSNLFDVNNAIKLNGISELIINNDSVTFTTTNNYNQYGMIYKNLSSGEYTFGYHSQKNNANASIELRAYYIDDGSELGAVIKETNLNNSITFNYDSSKGYLVIWTRPNATTTVTYTGIVFCKGSELKDYEPYSEQSFLASTPNGLPGLPLGQTILDEIKNSPIHMSGVYWDDATSQYYIGDTKDYAKGKNVQRILKIVLDGSTAYGFNNGGIWHLGSSAIQTISGGEIMSFADLHGGKNPSFSNYFITQSDSYGGVANEWEEYYNTMCVTGSAGSIAINAGMFPTADEAGFKSFFAAHPTEIYAIAKEPIITDLTEEELAQYKVLCMNYPNTTITNDSGAYTEVEYVASPKEYIANLEKKHDNDIQQLKTAIIALGGTI